MTDSDHALDAIASAAETLIPELTERLRRHGLGEIEVSVGDLRLRVTDAAARDPAPGRAAVAPTMTADTPPSPARAAEAEPAQSAIPVASPGVGFFLYADGLGPGLQVAKGDALGHVEVLGVRHDVRAPRAGTVRHLVAESGEAVEYGQVVVDMEAAR
jgi:acetyl-CoA carboxylase biotin carboxyl carrier protein